MKRTHLKFALKGIATSTLIALLFIQVLYVAFEPTKASAVTATDNVVVTLVVDAGITISNGADCTMGPSNIGVTVNKANCTSSWVVNTNNALGYTLAVKASASPALVSGGNSFADYTPTTPGTPELWSVSSGAKEFGYSAYGTDVPTGTWGTSTAACGTSGNPDVTLKYHNTATSDKTIATRATVTPTAGVTSNICFQAEQNAIYAASGTYTATITGTATTL